MTQVDLSSITYILPILAFLIVFLISLFLIKRSELIKNIYIEVFISLAIAAIFASATAARTYVLAIVPWFAVVLIGMFFIMALSGFIGKDIFKTKWIGWAFIILLGLIFVITAFFVFSSYLSPYLPGSIGAPGNPGNPDTLRFFDWLYSPKIAGALLLIGIAVIAAWVVIKVK